MKVLLDSDILSMFAKIDQISLLKKLFGEERIAMTSRVRDEISMLLLTRAPAWEEGNWNP